MSDPAHNDVENGETANGRVRSIAWLGDARTALKHAELAMATAMRTNDFWKYDELEDAVDCLRAAVQSATEKSPNEKMSHE